MLKPYPRFHNVATYRNNSGKTNYNAGEVKVEQRFDHGLALLFAYTHSRLIDDASSVFSTTVLSSPNSSSLIAADTFRPWLERDVSSGDMPNVTAISGIYDLPAGHGHRFARVISATRSWAAGRSTQCPRCSRECRSPLPRPRTTIRLRVLRCSGRTWLAFPTWPRRCARPLIS